MKIHTLSRSWWRDAAIAGVTGGAVMLLYSLLTAGSVTELFWLPLTALAVELPYLPLPSGSWVPTLVGMAIHLMIAAAWGVGYGAFVSIFTRASDERLHRSWIFGGLAGLAFGVVVYLVMGLLVEPRIVNAVRLLNQSAFFIGHLVFGATTGLMLTSLTRNVAKRRYAVTMASEAEVGETVGRR